MGRERRPTITEAQVTGLTAALALKADANIQIAAGAGLTGGGDLSENRTIDVVSADDGITVNADNIKLNIVNDLVTTSATRPLECYSGQEAARRKTAISDADKTTPEISFVKRVLADSGTQIDKEILLKVYADYLNNLPETEFLFCPQIAGKYRTSGVNQYINTLYDLGEEENDAVQTTEATQPYLGGYIAPNENRYLNLVSGQTQTGLLNFTDVVFAAADSWTFNLTVKANNLGRIYLGSAYISIGASSIILHNGTDAVLTGTITPEVGKAYIFEFQYANGAGLIKANNVPLVTVAASKAITFGQVSYNSTYPFDGAVYFAHLTNTRKSESDSQKEYTILRSVFPEIESIAIGNQVWPTSNFEGTVAGDGTVIPEVQGATTDGNAELVTNTNFEADTTGWIAPSGNVLSRETDGSTYFARCTYGSNYQIGIATTATILQPNRTYKIRFKAKSPSSTNSFTSIGEIDGFFAAVTAPALLTTWQQYEYYIRVSAATILRLYSGGAAVVDIDDVSKEVGASDSTLVYNYVYATTGNRQPLKTLQQQRPQLCGVIMIIWLQIMGRFMGSCIIGTLCICLICIRLLRVGECRAKRTLTNWSQ